MIRTPRTVSVSLVTLGLIVAVAAAPADAGRPDRDPTVIETSRIAPLYPELAAASRTEATVLLAVLVDPDGGVRDVHVAESSAVNLGFEQAAEHAVRQWRYRPARRDGARVEGVSWHRLRFRPIDPIELEGIAGTLTQSRTSAALSKSTLFVSKPAVGAPGIGAPATSRANGRVSHAWAPPYPSRPGQLYDVRAKPRHTAGSGGGQ